MIFIVEAHICRSGSSESERLWTNGLWCTSSYTSFHTIKKQQRSKHRCEPWAETLPGAEPVLSHPLLLQLTSVLQLDRAGDEAHLTALLHQTSDPPVVVVLLRGNRETAMWVTDGDSRETALAAEEKPRVPCEVNSTDSNPSVWPVQEPLVYALVMSQSVQMLYKFSILE